MGYCGEEFVKLAVDPQGREDVEQVLHLNLSLWKPSRNVDFLKHIRTGIERNNDTFEGTVALGVRGSAVGHALKCIEDGT